MTDNDYIRAAVKLADRWAIYMPGQFVNSNEGLAVESPCGYMGVLDATPELLDALAAQLVRQVDAANKFHLATFVEFTDIRSDNDLKRVARVEDGDRTMNTIKAIVDSKVLK